MDELAHALAIDPIELRRINEPTRTRRQGTPFSSRTLVDAYARGAAAVWLERAHAAAAIAARRSLAGWAGRRHGLLSRLPLPEQRRVSRCTPTARRTSMPRPTKWGWAPRRCRLQHAAERLGLPIDHVSFHYGDSALPDSPMAGGSCQTISIVAAVQTAIDELHQAAGRPCPSSGWRVCRGDGEEDRAPRRRTVPHGHDPKASC